MAAALALTLPAAAASAQWDVEPNKPSKKSPAKTTKDKEAERLRKEADELFQRPGSGSKSEAGGAQTQTHDDSWVVAVLLVGDEQQNESAQIFLREVRTRGMLPEAYIQKRIRGTLVCVGSFSGPDDPRAKAELRRVQEIEIDGQRPYVTAWLAPPMKEGLAGSRPEYELTRAKEQYGNRALYTLQIAAYGRIDLERPTEKDLEEARRMAEEGAARLRQEGEEAFYHHGPRYSTVTVGVFDSTDFDPQIPSLKSSRLVAAQRRYPNNLYNGGRVKEKLKGGVERFQPSNLVVIPERPLDTAPPRPGAAKDPQALPGR